VDSAFSHTARFFCAVSDRIGQFWMSWRATS
jgi:hypothetical protein